MRRGDSERRGERQKKGRQSERRDGDSENRRR